MLLPSEIDKITDVINSHFVILEDELIGEIADRISKVGYANIVSLNQANILNQMGLLNNDIYNRLAKATEKTEDDIKKIMNEAMITSFKRDNIIFSKELVGDLKISESLMQTLKADVSRLNFDLNNLTGTTAMTTQTQFLDAVNRAHLEVISGAKSYTSAMIDAIDRIGNNGIDVLYPSGHRDKVEVATRRAIMTSVNQTNGELQLQRCQELGWDLVEVSAHYGARPTHAEWQGQVYSLTGSNGYKNFYEETEYGTMLGLCGINCRHTFYPYYEGSKLTYTKKELDEINNKKVWYNGKQMTYYQATQYQRYLERSIRKCTRQIEGNKQLLINDKDVDVNQVKYSIKNLQAKQNGIRNELAEFTKQVGLKESNRLYTIGKEVKLYKNPNAVIKSSINNIVKSVRDYNNEIAQKLGSDFYDGVRNLVDKVKNKNLANVWDMYEGRMRIASINTKRAFHNRGSIWLDKMTTRDGNWYEKPYSVVFHEGGHAIDFFSSQKIQSNLYRNYFSARYKGGIFPQTLTDEVNAIISSKDKELKLLFKENFNKGNYQWFIDNGYIREWQYNFAKNNENELVKLFKYKKEYAYNDIVKEFNKKYSPYERSDISDMFEGATNGRVSFGFGHGKKYWNDFKAQGINCGLATEAFAEMTSATMAQEESLKVIKEVFPKSYKIYLEMLEEILK